MNKTKTLVVGGGFGGIKVALELANSEHFDVTLLSDQPNFHYFPTLYHTATGGRQAESSIPLTSLFEGKKIKLVNGRVENIDRHKHRVTTTDGKHYDYDNVVLSLGSVPNYFGIKGIEEFAYAIGTPEKAKQFKNHLHEQLVSQHAPDLNYVIVGGGPTGIELSGSLTGYLKEIMEAHGIKHRAVHVDLIEAAPKLLPRMPKAMSRAVTRRLRRLGVKIYLGKVVQGETADTLMVDGNPIQSHTVVWTAGTTNNPFFKNNGFALNERGKVKVDDYMQAEPDIFVIGDNADTKFSGMAQTALYDGDFIAENLKRNAEGKLMRRYEPKEPIYVIPAGPHWAAVLWGKTQIYGLPGWALRTLADLKGFSDYQPWWKAGAQWMTGFEGEEECPECAKHGLSNIQI
jgi:NADH dehydrogenase